jgi:hypothetical protein
MARGCLSYVYRPHLDTQTTAIRNEQRQNIQVSPSLSKPSTL